MNIHRKRGKYTVGTLFRKGSIKKFSNMLNGRKVITDVDVLNISSALEVEPNILFGLPEKSEQQARKEVI